VIYNRTTTENKAQYFRTAEELTELLRRVTTADWQAQRAVMKAIAERRYRWKLIADKYVEAMCDAATARETVVAREES
jgi:hypothetical protein